MSARNKATRKTPRAALNAEIGDVVLSMFHGSYDAEINRRPTFVEAVTKCTIDDLAALELALDSESTFDEMQRVLGRIRQRLVAAQWLDERLRDAVGHP